MRIDWKHWASVTVTVAGAAVALFLLCRYLFVLVLPFLLALLLAFGTRRLTLRFSARTGCPQKASAVIVTLFALVLLALFVFVLCNRLVLEAQNLLEFLARDSDDPEGRIAQVISFFKNLWGRLPFLSHLAHAELLTELLGDPEAYLVGQLQEFLSGVASSLAAFAGGVLRRLPRVLFFLVITVISCFYFAVEYEAVARALTGLLPQRLRALWPAWRDRAAEAAKRYLRAYLLLFLLTLVELSVGFFLLRVGYPFLLALLTAFLDILPVLGVGIVLVPFAVFSLVTGDIARGIGLLVLYAVITVVRQIAESHLVGKSLGLHPILMLVFFYVGLGLFGVAGVLLGPVLAMLVKALFEQKEAKV